MQREERYLNAGFGKSSLMKGQMPGSGVYRCTSHLFSCSQSMGHLPMLHLAFT